MIEAGNSAINVNVVACGEDRGDMGAALSKCEHFTARGNNNQTLLNFMYSARPAPSSSSSLSTWTSSLAVAARLCRW